jgi:ribosomal protein S18 acetylase RimI-like enzyme
MTTSVVGQVVLRAATPDDIAVISRIINVPPEPPLAHAIGPDRATRLGDLFVREGVTIAIPDTTVAVLDGEVVGVMDCGGGSTVELATGQALRMLPRILVIVWPVLPRALRSFWVRRYVQFDPVPEAFPVAELYVDERQRNRGIGGRLLEHAEALARERGAARMSIETGITNPARRLYERHGYTVIATKADPRYERISGSPGRILMVKELRAPEREPDSPRAVDISGGEHSF